MFFDQIFNSGAQRDISEATAQQWADATWGAGNRPIEPAEDMSDQYNTKLSDEQEGQFLQWARDNGRENDVRDYDLRGAWLEIQNGSMSEDDRGHLGDRYKKPNHPTFSAESIYNGEGGVTGGEWTTVNGVQTYTPGRKLTRNQAERLREYFEQYEVGSVLNLDGKVFDDEPRDNRIQAPRDPSLFDGVLSDAWKAIPNAAVRMGTTALTVASELMPEHGNAQNRAWIRENIIKSMRESAVKLDEWNRKNLGPDPEEMGKATQVIYGLLNTLPEIAVMMSGVGSVARLALGAGYKASRTSLAVGSALFGTDLGVAERNRLLSEDVDPSTARIAGWTSGVLNTVGVAIPPFLGASRTWSAIYGAGTNVGLNIAEIQGIKFILENSNYAQLAQQYELNIVDSVVAAGMGAAMGAAFWRNPTAVKYEKAQLRLKDRYRKDLMDGGVFSKEESDVQADINSRAVMSLARANGIAPDQIDSFAAKITWSKDSKSLSVPGEYAMPFTQGREWQFGDRAEKNPDYKVKVVRLEKENAPIPNNQGLAELIESYRGENGVRLENDTTGWHFSISSNDKNEIIHAIANRESGTPGRMAMVSVLKNLPAVVKNAFPAESYRDIKAPQGVRGVDESLKGVHRFYSPVVVGDGEYLVKITVKDRASDGGKKSKDRLSVYQIVGVEIEKAQPKAEPVSSGKVTDASAEGSSVDASLKNPVASRYPSDEITVREMLSGVKRDGDVIYVKKTGADGKEYWAKDETRRTRFFTEEPNQWAYEEKGGYWMDPNDQSGDLLQNGAIDGECAVVWDEASIKILHELEQAMGRDGSIRGAFQTGNNTIRLTPNANLSTFSHEHSHWYLTNLFRLAANGGASIDIQAQTLAILDAFGIKSLQDWQALGAKGQEKYQEQFAAWTEIYLSEGKSPLKGLEGVFAKLGQWLTEMYRDLIGKDADIETDPARKSVGDVYESRFNEKLPELSPQVREALDRMYGSQKKILGFKASTVQTAAARVIQSSRVNSDKTSAPIQDSQGPTAQFTAQDTQGKAASDLQKGEKVDVAETFADAPENQPVITETQNTFARGVSVGTGESARTVVLQNRNRSDPNSVAQMNSIAADPQYGRLSTSRTTQSGAPMVSFGRMPDSRYQGKTETVTESNGNKIPVTYYVVEADSVLRSNNYDGTPNKEWNEENPDRMRVIAGNGRMAGLSEAYNRGTAENYRNDLIADEASHGISADAIRSMKHPVLVRYMPPDRVTTGFVERSNTSDVLVRSALETAVQDSPKIRKNIDKYEFDDDGDPTKETLGQFLSDVGEISEMGNLIGSDGQPTTTARNRIRAALFYEAYRDRVLTELVADSEDKQGIKRILNAMSAFAPRVIQIREASKGEIDLAPFITGAAHRILQAKINGEGVDFTSQVDMFNSDPATDIMTEFFSQNRNSAAGMLRVLRPFAESVQNAMQAADSPLFGDLAVKIDLADAIGMFRKAQNDEIRARSGNVLGEDPSGLLPEIDVNAIRKSVEAAAKAAKEAAQLTKTMAEEAEKVNEAATPQAQEARAQEFAEAQERARNVLSDDSVGARALNLTLEDPQRMTILGENAMTAETVVQERAQVDKQVSDDAAGIGTGIACIIRNGGIKQ